MDQAGKQGPEAVTGKAVYTSYVKIYNKCKVYYCMSVIGVLYWPIVPERVTRGDYHQ